MREFSSSIKHSIVFRKIFSRKKKQSAQFKINYEKQNDSDEWNTHLEIIVHHRDAVDTSIHNFQKYASDKNT